MVAIPDNVGPGPTPDMGIEPLVAFTHLKLPSMPCFHSRAELPGGGCPQQRPGLAIDMAVDGDKAATYDNQGYYIVNVFPEHRLLSF